MLQCALIICAPTTATAGVVAPQSVPEAESRHLTSLRGDNGRGNTNGFPTWDVPGKVGGLTPSWWGWKEYIIQRSWHTETPGGSRNAARVPSPKTGLNLNASIQSVTDHLGDSLLHVLFYNCQSSEVKGRWKWIGSSIKIRERIKVTGTSVIK